MPTTKDFVDYVLDQVGNDIGALFVKRMFGEYLIYINEKPLLFLFNDTVYVKLKPEIEELTQDYVRGEPFPGAKNWIVIDIDNSTMFQRIASILEKVTPVPIPKKRKTIRSN